MGLHVHSLGELPTDAERDYYVYLLGYGWYGAGNSPQAAIQLVALLAGQIDVEKYLLAIAWLSAIYQDKER